MSGKNKKNKKPVSLGMKRIKYAFWGFPFQRNIILLTAVLAIFLIIVTGSIPKKYKLTEGMESAHDITAPRDIENKYLTEKKAYEASLSVSAIINRSPDIPLEVLNEIDLFFAMINRQKAAVIETPGNVPDAINELIESQKDFKMKDPLTEEQYDYLLRTIPKDELTLLERTLKDLATNLMSEEVTALNINQKTDNLRYRIDEKPMDLRTKEIALYLLSSFSRPNSEIDVAATEKQRLAAYDNSIENNKVIIKKNTRILSVGDIVTEDKLQMLEELNMLDTGKTDYSFMAGILILVLMIFSVMILLIKIFTPQLLKNRSQLLLAFCIMVMSILSGRLLYHFSPYYVPYAVCAMLLAIILNVRLALLLNFFNALFIAVMTGTDLPFIYMIISGGTFGAIMVHKATQRSKMSKAGIFVALSNILITVSYGIINKTPVNTLLTNLLFSVGNGLVTVIITIGLLPFFESTFNLITPLKLMELSNPNQPLLKRLMVEAPGTYHHSLMVGNLAEIAVERLGGNSLLARVGAYYHDIGKLKRPDFFGENQISDNPHNDMPPNLSASLIMSHTGDGLRIADKYKLPQAIKEIIVQHHGTSMVAYFYHKAVSDEMININENDFRYRGPKPSSTEAAVVMLADSVEAAVRSMTKKTEDEIELLIRRIIKDKMEDGQLNLTEITFRDLEAITNAFTAVFSGFFHAREKYPEMNINKIDIVK